MSDGTFLSVDAVMDKRGGAGSAKGKVLALMTLRTSIAETILPRSGLIRISDSGGVYFYPVDAVKYRNHFEEVVQHDPINLPPGSFDRLRLIGLAIVVSGDVVNKSVVDMLFNLQMNSGYETAAPVAIIRHASTSVARGRESPTYLPLANLLGPSKRERTSLGAVRFVPINKNHCFPKFATKEIKAAEESFSKIVAAVRKRIFADIFDVTSRLGPKPSTTSAPIPPFEGLLYSTVTGGQLVEPDVYAFRLYFHGRAQCERTFERIRLFEAEDREVDEDEDKDEEEGDGGEEEEEEEEDEEDEEEDDDSGPRRRSATSERGYLPSMRGGLQAITGMDASVSARKRQRATPKEAAATSTDQRGNRASPASIEECAPPTQRARTSSQTTTAMDLSELGRAHASTYDVLATLLKRHEAHVADLIHETRASIAEEQVRMEQRMATLGETLDVQIQAIVDRRFGELTKSFKSSESSATIRTIIREEVAEMFTSVLDAQKQLFTSAYIANGPTPKKRTEPSPDHDLESPARLRRDHTPPGRQLARSETNLDSAPAAAAAPRLQDSRPTPAAAAAAAAAAPRLQDSRPAPAAAAAAAAAPRLQDSGPAPAAAAAAAAAPRLQDSGPAPAALPTRSQPPRDAADGPPPPVPDQVRAYLVGLFSEGR